MAFDHWKPVVELLRRYFEEPAGGVGLSDIRPEAPGIVLVGRRGGEHALPPGGNRPSTRDSESRSTATTGSSTPFSTDQAERAASRRVIRRTGLAPMVLEPGRRVSSHARARASFGVVAS